MIESPKNFIEQFQNFIEHIAGVMKTFLTKEVADNYYLGKTEKASSASLADTATKATQDANGNVIPETYATKSELTSGLATKQPVGDYRTKSELDSIYLGINAKAKSAEFADSAATVVGEFRFSTEPLVTVSKTVSKSSTVSVTFDINGLIVSTSDTANSLGSLYVNLNGKEYDMNADNYEAKFVVFPGFTVQLRNAKSFNNTGIFTIQPIKIVSNT